MRRIRESQPSIVPVTRSETRRRPGGYRTASFGTLVAALIVSAAALVAAPAGPASAKAVTAVTVTGKGWGHGRGLSQYGAQNAAKNLGQSAAQILDFYYPGTAAGATGGRLAILLTADTTDSVIVAAAPGLRVRNAANGRTYALKRTGAKRWRMVASGTRTKVQAKRTGGTWRTVRVVHGQGEFYRTAKRTLTLVLPGGAKAEYRGRLRSAYAGAATSRDTVNVVSVEDYLRGVVPSEVPASWHPEAVKAQAVAARTYAVFARDNGSRYFDLCDTSACQVYRGVVAEKPAADAAIAATRGVIRTYNGAAAFTQFSSTNGGYSTNGSASQPYLTARSDPWDLWSGNPYSSWTVNLTDAQVEAAYPAIGDLTGLTVVTDPALGGRATSVSIAGSGGTVNVTADQFRIKFGLRSTMFNASLTTTP